MNINILLKLTFPKRNKSIEVDRYALESPNILSISDEKIKKLNHLFLNVYGHGRYSKAHHYFLQGLVHYNVFDFDEWKDQLSKECIKDVFNIEPKLFEPFEIEKYYKKVGILDKNQ